MAMNYMQVVEQTREEKIKMYMKCTKKELAEMLTNCNAVAEAFIKERQMNERLKT